VDEAGTVRRSRIVVIGASAGGVEALVLLVARLPESFRIPVFVVLHIPPTTSYLPEILSRAGPLPSVHAIDGDTVEPGRVVIAPPDRHLLLEAGRVRLDDGPKENGHRPAINPLFRSAAEAYGAGVIAVVLSGSLHDGALGAVAVHRQGGLVVVQDPNEAVYPAMPASAIGATPPDQVLPISAIAELLERLDGASGPDAAQSKGEESRNGTDSTTFVGHAMTQTPDLGQGRDE
jgi:two-component system, chemotaxis family, protein-glutamate methylesterase/glutaminase